jgi:hypothetical protein
MITSPKLPPKEGYVEVEIDGVHQYQPTQETLEQQEKDAQLKDLQDRLASTQDALDALLMGDVTPTTDTTT